MLSKIELFNAKNSGRKIEDGLVFECAGVGTFPDTDKDGNAVNVSCFKTPTGEIYTSISSTIADSLPMLDEILGEEGTVKVAVHENTSSNGRKFYQISIVA